MVFFSYCVTVFFFRQKAISLKRLPEVEEVLKVRRQFKTLETPSNTTWLVLWNSICQFIVGYVFNGVTWRVIDQLWGQDGWLSGRFSRVKDRPMFSALGRVADITKPRLVTPVKQRWDPCSGPPTDWVVLFEFPFSLVGKSTMAFPTGLWRIQGKDPGGPSPPLIFGPNKIFLGHGPPPPPLI